MAYEYLDYKNQVYENKYNEVKTYIVNKFQSFIDVSHIQENAIKLGYEKNMSKKEFIDKKIIDLIQSDLYVKDKIPMDGTFYFYIMNSTCHFLVYSHNATMKRPDGHGLQACEDKTHDLFVTDNYPSTGTEGFVNAVINKIFLGDDDGKADLTSSIAIDWDSISERIRSHIVLTNVKFVLTDSQQFLLMDCNSKECSSMQEYATTHYASLDGVTKDSVGPKYDPQNYSGYTLCKDEAFHPDFNTYGKLRTKILEDWHLRMYVSDLVTPSFCSK